MADERMIIIKIQSSDNTVDNKPKTVEDDGEVKINTNELLHPIKTIENKTIGKTIALNMAYQQAKELGIQALEFYINRTATLKEDYLMQTTYNNVKTTIGKTANILSSFVGGAVTGAQVGGVYGAIAGAVIGTVGYGISESIALKNRLSGYYQNLNSSNSSTAFLRQRAGLNNDGRGTEN